MHYSVHSILEFDSSPAFHKRSGAGSIKLLISGLFIYTKKEEEEEELSLCLEEICVAFRVCRLQWATGRKLVFRNYASATSANWHRDVVLARSSIFLLLMFSSSFLSLSFFREIRFDLAN